MTHLGTSLVGHGRIPFFRNQSPREGEGHNLIKFSRLRDSANIDHGVQGIDFLSKFVYVGKNPFFEAGAVEQQTTFQPGHLGRDFLYLTDFLTAWSCSLKIVYVGKILRL